MTQSLKRTRFIKRIIVLALCNTLWISSHHSPASANSEVAPSSELGIVFELISVLAGVSALGPAITQWVDDLINNRERPDPDIPTSDVGLTIVVPLLRVFAHGHASQLRNVMNIVKKANCLKTKHPQQCIVATTQSVFNELRRTPNMMRRIEQAALFQRKAKKHTQPMQRTPSAPTKTHLETEQPTCKDEVTDGSMRLPTSRIIKYNKVAEQEVSAVLNQQTHKKKFIICVQKSVHVSPTTVREITDQFKEIIFPLVTNITGTVPKHEHIYLNIIKITPGIDGFFNHSFNRLNKMYVMPPPEHSLLADNQYKYLSLITHEYTHLVHHMYRLLLKYPQWLNNFFTEGLAEFAAMEYVFTKQEQHMRLEVIQRMIVPDVYFLSIFLTPRPTCFLDRSVLFEGTTKQLDDQLQKKMYIKTIYDVGAFFMQFILYRFFPHQNPTHSLGQPKSYRIFNDIVKKSDPLASLWSHTNRTLKTSKGQFCEQFLDYFQNLQGAMTIPIFQDALLNQ